MTCTVLCSGLVFDGTGSTAANADVVVEGGLIVDDVLGTPEPGKGADLVVFSGEELDVSDLRPRVAMVFQDGRLVAGDGDAEDRPLVLGSHE